MFAVGVEEHALNDVEGHGCLASQANAAERCGGKTQFQQRGHAKSCAAANNGVLASEWVSGRRSTS